MSIPLIPDFYVQVHSAVLSASSDFFKMILREHPAHIPPVIVIDDVDLPYMQEIINYLYSGVIAIDSMKARNFLKVCSCFQIKGLMTYEILSPEDEEEAGPIEVTIEEEVYEDQDTERDLDLLVFLNSHTSDSSTAGTSKPPMMEVEDVKVEAEVGNTDDQPTEYFLSQSEAITLPPSAAVKRTKRTRNQLTLVAPEKKKHKQREGYTEDQLNDSMESVCSGEMNLSTASQMFNVPKSVLWRKLQKRSDYVPHPQEKGREEAKKAILNGEPMDVVHRKFNIPLATLYRDKQKLIREGTIKSIRNKLEVQDALLQALAACENGMAQSEAARKFNVSKSTLWRKLKKSAVSE